MEKDVNNVLKEYIRICNNNSSLLQHHLASNSILEWFGRTVCGHANICSYYRFDLCEQYEHDFQKAESCSAIESRPSHTQTKTVSNIDKVNEFTQELTLELHTTPSQRIPTATLPKVDRGKTFISTPEASPKNYAVTPPTKSKNDQDDDEPPIKRTKWFESGGGDSQREKPSKSTQESVANVVNIDPPEIGQGDTSTSSLQFQPMPTETGYTELMYLESTGFLHIRPRQKHRGITSSTMHPGDATTSTTSPVTSSNIDLDTTSHLRKTKLKLSYRIRRHDNHLQFALIIYEHLTSNSRTRRNLLSEFQKVIDKKNTTPKSINRSSTITTTSSGGKSLKRPLRF